MLQVKMDDFLIDVAGILEDDRCHIIRITEGELKERIRNDLRYQAYRRET